MKERLQALQVMKAFVDEGEEIAELEDTLTWFIENCGEDIADSVHDLESRALAGKERKKIINARQKQYEGRAANLRKFVVNIMKELGLDAFEAGIFGTVLRLDASTPSLHILDEEKILDEYYDTEIIPEQTVKTLNKEKLKAACIIAQGKGERVAGAETVQSQYLKIPGRPKETAVEEAQSR